MKRTGPLDDIPRTLTDEAEHDKRVWLVAMATMKGKERLDNIRLFISRYKSVPHIPVLDPPK